MWLGRWTRVRRCRGSRCSIELREGRDGAEQEKWLDKCPGVTASGKPLSRDALRVQLQVAKAQHVAIRAAARASSPPRLRLVNMVTDDTDDVWERQPHETPKQYAAFC